MQARVQPREALNSVVLREVEWYLRMRNEVYRARARARARE